MSIWILSPQQRQVLQLIAGGFTNKEIAAVLMIEKSTVKNVVSAIFKKLNAQCRVDAVFAGIRFGEINELLAYAHLEARQIGWVTQDECQHLCFAYGVSCAEVFLRARCLRMV